MTNKPFSSVLTKFSLLNILLVFCAFLTGVYYEAIPSPFFIFIMLAALTSVSVFFLYFLVLRPIKKVSNILKHVSKLDFNWYCETNRADEIGELIFNTNSLLNNMQATISTLKGENKKLKAELRNDRLTEHKRMIFISSISHELKTPVTIIKGQIESMIMNIGVYKNKDLYLKKTLKVANRLDRLLKSILTIANLDDTNYRLQKTEFPFSSLMDDVMEDYNEILRQKNISLNVSIEETITVFADEILISKLLGSLFSNASNYASENTTITVKAERKYSGVFFSIENEGDRIPEDAMPYLFNAFYSADKERSRLNGGSGMGLYIAKIIWELHYANYKIENTDKGVRVWFMLE